MTDYTWKYLLLLFLLLFVATGCTERAISAAEQADAPAAPADPTKPATATWVAGSWIINGDTRTWSPAHWSVQQDGQSTAVSATITPPVQVIQQPVQVLRYVGTPTYRSYPTYDRDGFPMYDSHTTIYAQPCVPNRVSIYGGFTGASYGIEVYQPQYRPQYYSDCHNDNVIRLHHPNRNY